MRKILIGAITCATLLTNTYANIFALESTNDTLVSTSENISIKTTLNVKATAYAGDSITSTGTTPTWGTIAVDPAIIPYGTKIYIPEFNTVFTAEDCGSAIKGNKIDIFMDSEDSCIKFGVQNLEIIILN